MTTPELKALPKPGTLIRCADNKDRPELTVGQAYTVISDPDLGRLSYPINYNRQQPEDFRLVCIKMPGQKENGYFPIGIFEY